MERKIGKIFEFGGEWYQCVESDSCGECSLRTTECRNGTKSNIADEIFGECSKVRRPDNKHAIFKKLEKVGEPFSDEHFGLVQKYELKMYGYSTKDKRVCFADGYDVFIKIKQTKEDMEEKKHCDGCKYSDEEMKIIEKAEKDVRKAMGGAFGLPKDIPYLHSFVSSALELGWLDKYKEHPNSEKIEKYLKEFSLEAAKAGKTVCTRDGRKARIICFDRNDLYPIVALIECEDGKEMIGAYSKEGHTEIYEIKGTDLMMLPEKKEGWVNVYPDDRMGEKRYSTKEEALCYSRSNVIDTVKVEWEE